jgi:hypothetical protein
MNNTCRSPYHQIPLLGCTSIPSRPSITKVSSADPMNIGTTYLFNLAFPALFGFMWPFICKCSLSGLNHPDARRIFLAQIPILLLNCRNNSPAATRRMFQMLNQRIIIFLPPIQRFMAEKAGDVVGVALCWVVEETGFCKLNACQ